MRARRITILQLMIALCILGLLFSVPLQCRRAMEADDARMAAEHHRVLAAEFSLMARDPARWMDPFRADLLRMSLREEKHGAQLARSETYLQAREDETAWLDRSLHNENEF